MEPFYFDFHFLHLFGSFRKIIFKNSLRILKMATFKAVVLKGKNDLKNDGTTNIKIRITHKSKVEYISTDYFIQPRFMDNKQGIVSGGGNHDYLNLQLTNKIQKYRLVCIELGEKLDYMTVKEIKNSFTTTKQDEKHLDFFTYAEMLIENTIVTGTAESYRSLLDSLEKFVRVRKLFFSSINLIFLKNYELFLRKRGVGNGVINYMSAFRSIFNKARDFYNDEDLGIIKIPHYPFKKYEMPKRKVKSKDHVLELEQLKYLIKFKSDDKNKTFATDMFMLMFYLIGIEAKDLFFLKKPKRGRVMYDRFKTGGEFSIKLEPEAIQIIDKYKPEGKSPYLLNVNEHFQHHKSFYRKINSHFHGDDSHNIQGIFNNIKVTTKWARHTWATIARNDCRISKDDVALCLGHKDIDNAVTDTYIRYDYSIIDECNRKVIDFIS